MLISRVRDRFQLNLPIQRLFEKPTVAELALSLTQSLAEEGEELARMIEDLKGLSDAKLRAVIDEGRTAEGT